METVDGFFIKHEKKIEISFDKNIFFFKLSDIHIEIDLFNLGCNSKLIWNDFFSTLLNIIVNNNYNKFFIICKNFHAIHNELHEVFYSYMQTIPNVNFKIYFIIITTNISFINQFIINSSYILSLKRPNKRLYSKLDINIKNDDVNNINSIKAYKSNIFINDTTFYNCLFSQIIKNNIDFFSLRNILYDILIYNINIDKCIWYIYLKFINLHSSNNIQLNISYIFFDFYWNYNNNYRPIYHLEKLFIYLINEHQRIMQNSTN